MRVAIVAESFLPQVNGVSTSVCRVTDELERLGHHVEIFAPGTGPDHHGPVPVQRFRAVTVRGAQDTVAAVSTVRSLTAALRESAPDVVHLASPTWFGRAGMSAACRLGLPTVAVFQTDVAAFARQYPLWRTIGDEPIWAWLRRVHERADRTLAPSSATMADLAARGVPRLRLWGRGVDLLTFHPVRRDPELRRELAPNGELLVGYVGRLAPEKDVQALTALRGLPGVRVVVVGRGPDEARLREALPDAAFVGFRSGTDLARHYASLDLFVHTGAHETFCQGVQEAMASGVAALAPAAGGPLDLIHPGLTGAFFAPGDGDDLRRQVATLTADPADLTRRGERARTAVLGRSWATLTRDLLTHYEDVVDAPVTRTEDARRRVGVRRGGKG